MTKDDRGREVPLWAAGWGVSGEGTRRDLPAELKAKLMSGWSDPGNRGPGMLSLRAKIRGRHVAWMLLWFLAFIGFMFAAMALGFPAIATPIFAGASGLLLANTQARRSRKRFESMTRSTLLHEGYCAGCAYPLAALPVDQDGCVVCPECEAAWRPVGGATFQTAAVEDVTELWKPLVPKGWIHHSPWLQFLTLGAFGHPRLVTIQDDSGKLVEVVRDAGGLQQTPGWGGLTAESRVEIVRAFRRRAMASRFAVLAGIAFLGLVAWAGVRAWLVAVPQLSLAYVGITLKMAFLAMMALATPLWLMRPPVWNRVEHADVLRSRGLCPRCASKLGFDGTGCGTCGAVWKGKAGASEPQTAPDPKRT